ncbi:hypothetical protein [Zavarzinia sp. CC-PAN008]|uniref:hypothetical protein n=1 Tax=Zavarzinia sp. CC-PAN008 TaxID=3243332 RepID=UPI003F748F95
MRTWRWSLAALLVAGNLGLGLVAAADQAQAEERERTGGQEAIAAFRQLDQKQIYTDAQVREALRGNDRASSWWGHIDEPFRARLLSSPPERWLSVIICNYSGELPGSEGAQRCEDAHVNRTVRTATQWDANGNFVGPSEACRKANLRTQYGELICDAAPQRPPGS